MAKERILITVRTYPTPSAKYIETVCTGGITDGGEWRRLVPVPLRYLDEAQVYRTFDVIEIDVAPGRDGRPETRRPHLPSLRVVDHVGDWFSRWQWVRPTIEPSLRAMVAAKKTLAPVAANEVLDLVPKRVPPEWSATQREKLKQDQLFDEQKPLEKIPYEFRFIWRDEAGDEHEWLVMSWEMVETFRQYRTRYSDPIAVMRTKWLEDLCGPTRRVSFFMGNLVSRRPVYCICGVFSPPREVTQDASLW